MVSLKIDEELKKRHKSYLLSTNLKESLDILVQEEFLDELKKLDMELFNETRQFYKYLLNEYLCLEEDKSNIFLAEPKILQGKIQHIRVKYKRLSEEFRSGRKILNKTYSDRLLKIIGYEEFSNAGLKGVKGEEGIVDLFNYRKYRVDNPDSWSAYDFVMSMGLKVCPYCNRNFITPLYAERRKTRAALDHFWDKKRYPYLSMSIYNLVPCCSVCNSSFKNTNEFEFEKNINPYEDISIEGLYHFTYQVNKYADFAGKTNLDVKIMYNESDDADRIKCNNKLFRIEKIYQYHSDVVGKLLQKKRIYDENYIDYLAKNYNLFDSREEVIELLTEAVEEKEVKNHILGKLIYDIVKELEF